ncbi:MAG TPA: hypothetical protein VEC60_07840 [Reyranella sp.]|nr:hypothetical protein [Reyranella sp.]
MRQLGADLAAAGYPTLRFDYPAAGNSLDGDLNHGGLHWTAWQRSIEGAIEWLRAVCRARTVVLCGFATGGTLAALVTARRSDVAGLLLLEPVIVGRNLVRQLGLEADLQRDEDAPREQGLEIREMRFGPLTVAQIAGTDLRELVLPAGLKVAIFAKADSQAADDCARAWSDRGIAASRHGFDGMHGLLGTEPLDEVPLADFTAAIDWLEQAIPAGPVAGQPISLPVFVLQPPGCIDAPLRFGPESRLFGMLCRPARGHSDDVVLIPSNGREPSSGAARQNVALARRLAEAGIASFRFDFAGLGDSLGPPGKEHVCGPAFADRTDDIRAAIDTLAGLGFSRFAGHGLGLGAYHALQAAVVEPRLSTLILTNLPLFTAPASDAASPLEPRSRSTVEVLLRAARLHVRNRIVARLARMARRFGRGSQQSFAHRAMAALSQRGVRTLYLFSAGPRNIEAFAAEFGADGHGLAVYPGAAMRVIPGMDPSLTVTAGRLPAETLMVEFVLAGRAEKSAR